MEHDTDAVANNPASTYRLGGATGRGFLPGQSGNLSGRPKSPATDLLRNRLAAGLGAELIDVLAGFALGKRKAPPSVRLQAAMYLLDRAEGKPIQAVDVSGDGGEAWAEAMAGVAAAVRGAVAQLEAPQEAAAHDLG